MTATEILDALYEFGVENWDGYSIALEDLDIVESSDEEILEALEDAGVDNWEGYDYAMSSLEK